MTVVITGWNSKIAEEFRRLTREQCIRGDWRTVDFPKSEARYLFCHGLLMPKRAKDQTDDETTASWWGNYVSVATACDAVLQANPEARICVIGSESGYRGSYDDTYATTKDAVHRYVEERALRPAQQLVAISPGIIEDAGMTTRRTDTANVERRRREHPMRRFLTSAEVADMAHFLLYRAPYVSGTVIRMHGGQP